MSPAAFWPMMLGMAAAAYLFRASFLLLGERTRPPAWLQRALDFVPPAVLAALVLPVFVDVQAAWTQLDTARLIAGAAAALAAYRTRSVPLTLVVGMAGLWLMLALLPGA